MSYVTQSHANRPAAIAGVVGIHAALGALIVLGLSTNVVTRIVDPNVDTFNVTPDPPPPPPPKKNAEPDTATPNQQVFVPPVPSPLPPKPNFIDTTTVLPPLSDEIILKALPKIDEVAPVPIPTASPIAASPRNNPAHWVTDSDYKSRWVREGLSGTARFNLEISANGRVESCRITKSTGHSALDQATCSLIKKRARFEPATDANGASARGSYSSAIHWTLPD